MYTPCNDSAGLARNILDAWQRKDLDGLKAGLNLSSNLPGDNAEEQERMDLLQGIANQIKQGLPGQSLTGVCIRLLEHLALSGSHPEIRPRKLAFFPN